MALRLVSLGRAACHQSKAHASWNSNRHWFIAAVKTVADFSALTAPLQQGGQSRSVRLLSLREAFQLLATNGPVCFLVGESRSLMVSPRIWPEFIPTRLPAWFCSRPTTGWPASRNITCPSCRRAGCSLNVFPRKIICAIITDQLECWWPVRIALCPRNLAGVSTMVTPARSDSGNFRKTITLRSWSSHRNSETDRRVLAGESPLSEFKSEDREANEKSFAFCLFKRLRASDSGRCKRLFRKLHAMIEVMIRSEQGRIQNGRPWPRPKCHCLPSCDQKSGVEVLGVCDN